MSKSVVFTTELAANSETPDKATMTLEHPNQRTQQYIDKHTGEEADKPVTMVDRYVSACLSLDLYRFSLAAASPEIQEASFLDDLIDTVNSLWEGLSQEERIQARKRVEELLKANPDLPEITEGPTS